MNKKRKTYSEEALQNALHAIRGGMSYGLASRGFQIPKTTLIDKMHNKYAEGSTSGAQCVLTKPEEEIVVNWILYLEGVGFPVTKNQLLECVAELVRRLKRPNKFKNGVPGRHWYENFFSRHPELSHRVSQNLTKPRASITEKNIRDWFGRVSEYLTEHNLADILNDPRRIFNCDESAFFLSPKEKFVIVRKGSKKVYTRIANDEKECLTVLVTISADGGVLRPTVLFPYKRVPPSIHLKMPTGWGIGRSDTGWMTSECFYEFVTNVFYNWLVDNNIPMPVILFLDGHSSHLSLPVTEFCKSKGIILIALLPNSTHRLQPLDVAVFHPVKNAWKNQVQKWRLENNGQKLKREDFASQLHICLKAGATAETVKNGFRACGLFPFDANNIDYSKLLIQVQTANDPLETINAPIVQTAETAKEKPNFLFEIEKYLDIKTLTEFETSGDNWNGRLENKGLFDFWKKVKDQNNKSTLLNSTTDHEATLNANMPDLGNDSVDLELNIPDMWLDHNCVFDLEVQDDGIIQIPHLETSSPQKGKEVEVVYIEPVGKTFNTTERTNDVDGLVSIDIDKEVPEVLLPIVNNVVSQKTPENNSNKTDGTAGKENLKSPTIPTPLKNVATPFKKALFWPETNKGEKVKKVTKKVTPTVATSEEFMEYQRRIDSEKKKKEQEKLQRIMKKKEKEALSKKSNFVKQTKVGKPNGKAELKDKSEDNVHDEAEFKDNKPPTAKTTSVFKKGDYVIVNYEEEFFPGLVVESDLSGVVVKTMAMSGPNWKWPNKDDILTYTTNEILCNINPPTLINKRGIYSVPQIEVLREAKKTKM